MRRSNVYRTSLVGVPRSKHVPLNGPYGLSFDSAMRNAVNYEAFQLTQ
jgi:hypothetical protein